jgi:hypothetical protein
VPVGEQDYCGVARLSTGLTLAALAHINKAYRHAYLDGSGISADPKGPLFRTIGRTTGQLTRTPLSQANAHAMIRRRAAITGIIAPAIAIVATPATTSPRPPR